MYPRNPARSITNGISGGIVLIGLALAFLIPPGGFNLPIFFVALAISTLVGSLGTLNPRRIYSGFYGFLWLLIVALFFVTHSWVVFLIGAGISLILGALFRPIIAGLLGIGFLSAASMVNRPPQQPPYQPPYQPYQEGYQPPQPTYQEGSGQQYNYPPQGYEQPQTQYPQELPPQQQ